MRQYAAGDFFAAEEATVDATGWRGLHLGKVAIAMPFSGVLYVKFEKIPELRRFTYNELRSGMVIDVVVDWRTKCP
jgi:hypothetical protein